MCVFFFFLHTESTFEDTVSIFKDKHYEHGPRLYDSTQRRLLIQPKDKHKIVTFFFFFLATVLSQWNFSHGKCGLLSPKNASCDRVALPNLRCMLGVLVFP